MNILPDIFVLTKNTGSSKIKIVKPVRQFCSIFAIFHTCFEKDGFLIILIFKRKKSSKRIDLRLSVLLFR